MQNISTNYKLTKPGDISGLKLKQLRYEKDTLKRLLDFMLDENVHMKNRLSEVLQEKFDKNLLKGIEVFQSSFIKEDELIGLLRNDVAELDKLLVIEIFDDNIMEVIYKKLSMLRNNIVTAEKQFEKLKLDFNSYLSENM